MTLTGRVLTVDGVAAGGAVLEYFDPDGFSPEDGKDALVAPDGTFAIDVPVGAKGELRVAKPGCGAVIVPLDGTNAFRDIRLGAARRLVVHVKPSERTREAAGVRVQRPGGFAQWDGAAEVEEHEDGSSTWDLPGLAPRQVDRPHRRRRRAGAISTR
jgi:hypothetical protein